jgi:hypothetical protein
MYRLNQEEGRYRVLLIGIGGNTEEEKGSFCHNLSKNFGISLPLLKKIVDRCPIILKKNLSLKKAETLAKTLKSYGASVSVEERRYLLPISLEFQELVPHQLALESSYLKKPSRGTWSVIGRAKNISYETLSDNWALIQLFDAFEEFITFEEAPLPINPLPPGEVSPFKVVFEGDFTIKRISIAFKNASGLPIPTVDKRKKGEWVEVEINDEGVRFYPPPWISKELEGRSQIIELTEPAEEMLMEKGKEIPKETVSHLNQEVSSFPGEEIREKQRRDAEEFAEESLLLTLDGDSSERIFEPSPKDFEIAPNLPGGNGYPAGDELKIAFEGETFQTLPPHGPEELEGTTEEGEALGDLEPHSYDEEVTEESRVDVSVFEEATQLLEDISEGTKEIEVEEKIEETGKRGVEEVEEEKVEEEKVEEEETPTFLWIENFRDAVETYYQKPHDIFSIWFEECRKEGEFKNPLHSLLTILVHARFEQGDQSIKALENTQRVFKLIIQPNLLLEEVPPLEGTPFASGEIWKELFYKAIPKVQQIGNAILEKNRWRAFDLEQAIQVIPHMGHPNSQIAIRWINKLIPDVVELNFSDTSISIDESLYRVASRLGIVDPHFDYYQGRNSMGDIRIQSFAKMAFPQNPVKIEEPMAWVGGGKEQGGHCFPTQPGCEGCLFETFCPKLYIHFNPSEKGMRE